jgi:hypothetical protein
MDNTLQIKLTADITALQSALTKAKKTIQTFEDSTNKESEKGNVGFKRKIGLIEALTNKSKVLRTALSQATNEKDVERYNKELQQTINEMTRLNALGRQVSQSVGATSQSFKGATQNIGSANGVAIEFSRIIQDAPFGIIGIGNNLQQLTANFAQTSKAAGGAGAAIKASLGALISPANLLVLGISAVTAAFTAYQMGAFDGLFATEDLAEAAEKAEEKLENYRNTLDAVTRASIEGTASGKEEARTFENLRAQAENANIPLKTRVEAVKELQSKYPDYLGNLTQEQILTGNVGDAYFDLTNQIIATAKARAFSDQIAKNSIDLLTKEQQELDRVSSILVERDKLEAIQASKKFATGQDLLALRNQEAIQQKRINELVFEQTASANDRSKIEKDNLDLQNQITNEISNGAKFTETQKETTEKLITSIEEQAERLGLISSLTKQIKDLNEQRDLSKSQEEINLLTGKIDLLKEELILINAIAKRANTPIDLGITPLAPRDGNVGVEAPNLAGGLIIPEGVKNIGLTDEELQSIEERNKIVLDSFSALGVGIAASLNIGDNALKGFITTLLSATPKIIQAIRTASQAKKAAAAQDVSTNLVVAKSEGVSVAAKAANALGPVGLALLPVFIGGAIALISSAIGKGGGGGGRGGSGGGGASSGLAPQLFTNKQSVSPPSPSSPNLNSGSIDQSNAQSRLFVDVSGDKLRFVLDRANERAKGG